MLSAQIKRGNSFLIDTLEDYLHQMILLPQNKSLKTVKLPYYNFVEAVVEVISEHIKIKTDVPFNLFLADFYVRKYEKTSDLYRHFLGLTQSWKKFLQSKEDAKLFLSLLTQSRNSREQVKRFHKIRKIILKTLNAKILEQIPVTHSDALTICHMLFEADDRNKVVKKINGLFISLKMKMVNTAKINGAVACQFFMSAFEELQSACYPTRQLHKLTSQQPHPRPNQSFTQLQAIPRKRAQYPSYPQYPQHPSYPQHRQPPETPNPHPQPEDSLGSGHWEQDDSCGQEHHFEGPAGVQGGHGLGEEGLGEEGLEGDGSFEGKGLFDLEMAKKSFNQLSRKDRDMDARLHGSGLVKLKNYPVGWDEFLQNNRIQKQKLLSKAK